MAARRLPVSVRPRAQRDIDDALGWYLDEAGVDVAGRLTEAVLDAFDLLGRNPRLGAPRDGLGLPGLRCWSLRPWPWLVFYIDASSILGVIRILHGARDIPASLAEPGASA